MTTFHALDVAYDLMRAVRAPIATVKAAHAPLATQLLRAAHSVPLNIAEGSALTAKSKANSYRIAHGSLREVEAALRTAELLGFIAAADIAVPLALCDRLRAMLWRLTH
jgi:four helix bundle protein